MLRPFFTLIILVAVLGALAIFRYSSIYEDRKIISETPLTETLSPISSTIPPKMEIAGEPRPDKKRVIEQEIMPRTIELPPKVSKPIPNILPLPSLVATTTEVELKKTSEPVPERIALPPLDEEAILRSVVKIECPAADGLGKYTGSGFAPKPGIVVTAGHVVAQAGSEECLIIFPLDRRPVRYLKGTIQNLPEVKKLHDERGIDIATLTLPPLESYPEARAIFQAYPAIPYEICKSSAVIGDSTLHFGYPSNYVDQSYLSELLGEVVLHADIKGVREQLSGDSTSVFKTPILEYTYDETSSHPYTVSQVASFYGDSGGLAFDKTKQCIIGVHRGGTIGKGSGENYTLIMNIGWVLSVFPEFFK